MKNGYLEPGVHQVSARAYLYADNFGAPSSVGLDINGLHPMASWRVTSGDRPIPPNWSRASKPWVSGISGGVAGRGPSGQPSKIEITIYRKSSTVDYWLRDVEGVTA